MVREDTNLVRMRLEKVSRLRQIDKLWKGLIIKIIVRKVMVAQCRY